MQAFRLIRKEDVSGVSGTGVVAVGVVFPNGHCVMQWQTGLDSIGHYNSLNDLISIHGHGGKTSVEVFASLDAFGNVPRVRRKRSRYGS